MLPSRDTSWRYNNLIITGFSPELQSRVVLIKKSKRFLFSFLCHIKAKDYKVRWGPCWSIQSWGEPWCMLVLCVKALPFEEFWCVCSYLLNSDAFCWLPFADFWYLCVAICSIYLVHKTCTCIDSILFVENCGWSNWNPVSATQNKIRLIGIVSSIVQLVSTLSKNLWCTKLTTVTCKCLTCPPLEVDWDQCSV